MRYLRLYAWFVRFSFTRALQFRLDFFFRVGMDAIWNAVNIAFFLALYRYTDLLGGWDRDQVLVFAAGLFFADGVQMTVFSNNFWWLPILVNKGDLDYYLVRPVSSLYFLSLRDFAANSFLNLLIATGILVWALARYPHPYGAGDVVLYVLLLLVGVVLLWAMRMLFLIPVFWLHTSRGLDETFFVLERYSSRPDGIWKGWIRRILVSVLPFAVQVSFAARAFFEGFSWSLVLHMVGVTAGVVLVVLWAWGRGLRAYSSASS